MNYDTLVVSRGQTPPSLCPASFENKSAGLRRHSCSEPMRFSSTPIVGLKSSLRHSWNLPSKENRKSNCHQTFCQESVLAIARKTAAEKLACREVLKVVEAMLEQP